MLSPRVVWCRVPSCLCRGSLTAGALNIAEGRRVVGRRAAAGPSSWISSLGVGGEADLWSHSDPDRLPHLQTSEAQIGLS